MLIDFLTFAVSAALLWFGASWIVTSAALIARKFNVSELVIGLTIVAMGTSAPEFLVTVNAAFRGHNDISLSNVVGSNIFNLGFILGLMAMIRPLVTTRTIVYRDGLLLFLTTAGILAVSFTGEMGRVFGAVLVGLLVCYLVYLGVKRESPGEAELEEIKGRAASWRDWLMLALGFAAISGGGHLMVTAATSIATDLGVSSWVIGVTIVAAGTSLPELVTCLAASVKGKNEMLLGNLIGSDFFNFAGVLGLTCLLKPLPVSPEAGSGLIVLVVMVGLVLVMLRTGWRITRLEGGLLVGITLLRWINDFTG
ncbi:MAG: calcium/sodium antiporter [Pseudodesulfovibrio sp.]|uniref:Na+/Ca+ antiporter, CaCA family n=1 Tax=Pseudodesulfovibrio aespoeensis (strain ATCC 700646 / DSM 10631 / Aspo-2) TaxID=643562 RepID=E6VWW5_PSEA9|nr:MULTISPECIES: calcium/sodium antiporter [Pseudodesulfovibrio]MBU4191183.1 calcium/sodium antiporter [Pseudomonadota bacterium]ADU63727.1 Na+/Ca+ antiporter, CaCA family [Pseudodesulfovibrio aespoeensis Aspo-2]MBU4243518.1 calcium/sodium antiporter [Pseudomonadota bacterium]MBU4476815.1 calcium/sodium antiporter [Pseudomonadota bacterium]MBU4515469.1 calcium/sodium antiporter [Pseudomonadota bacterium]